MLCSRAIYARESGDEWEHRRFRFDWTLRALAYSPHLNRATVNVELTSTSNICNSKSITCKVQFASLPSLRGIGGTNDV